MGSVPVFGELVAGADYKLRPSAYGILLNNEGLIAVIRGRGGCYLPGGGLEPGEDALTALKRECVEECSLLPEQLSRLGSAVQLLHAEGEGWFRIEGEFFSGRVTGAAEASPAHNFFWSEAQAAADAMTRQFERWAIEEWLGNRL